MKRYIRTAIRLIDDDTEEVRRAFALDPNTSPRDLAQLAESHNRYVRRDVAQNPNLPMDARIKLIEDTDLAFYPAIYYGDFTPEFLDELAHRADGKRFLQAIAQHKNTSPETLDWMAENNDEYYILSGVANNKNTSPETLTKLATHPNYELRAKVACNPHTPVAVLNQLAKDRNSLWVRERAVFTLGRLGEKV